VEGEIAKRLLKSTRIRLVANRSARPVGLRKAFQEPFSISREGGKFIDFMHHE
jgi:hypothetical protein